jgi:hypothetical protein
MARAQKHISVLDNEICQKGAAVKAQAKRGSVQTVKKSAVFVTDAPAKHQPRSVLFPNRTILQFSGFFPSRLSFNRISNALTRALQSVNKRMNTQYSTEVLSI